MARTVRSPIPLAVPNLLDRAIAVLSPISAARRLVARQQLALVGGYQGARKDKASLSSWRTSGGSPDSDVIADLPTLRDRCADLERNAPVAASVIHTHAQHAVGTGLAISPQLDHAFLGISEVEAAQWQADTRRRFNAWAENPDCSLDRELDFYGLQEQALRGVLSRGDIFVITPRVPRAGRAAQLALQFIEADRVCNPTGRTNSDTLTEGIECDAQTGETLAVHVCSHYPHDHTRSGVRSWQRITVRGDKTGRRNVLHLYRQLRPSLRRGVPVLAPVIEPIKQLTRYSEAELSAAVTSAIFALFLKMDPKAFEDLFDDASRAAIIERGTAWSGEMEGGKAINLLPGEEPVSHNPARPNAQFDPFTTSCMRQIGMAIGVPYEVLVLHFQSSYTAARGALLLAWRTFMGWRNFVARALCQPVYELWLADEVAAGRIAAPGFFADPIVRSAWCAAQWVGDGPGSIDPEKEARAARERVDLGISTLQTESLLHDGVDWETKHRQQVKEAAARREAGFSVPGAAATVKTQGPQDAAGGVTGSEKVVGDDNDDDTEVPPADMRGGNSTGSGRRLQHRR